MAFDHGQHPWHNILNYFPSNAKATRCYFSCQAGYHAVPVDFSKPMLPLKKPPTIKCKRTWDFPKGNYACRSNADCHVYPNFQKPQKPLFKGEFK